MNIRSFFLGFFFILQGICPMMTQQQFPMQRQVPLQNFPLQNAQIPVQNFPVIAGIKTPYIFTEEEGQQIQELNIQIKAVFAEIDKYQGVQRQINNSPVSEIPFLKNTQQVRSGEMSDRRSRGGKSLFQLRQERGGNRFPREVAASQSAVAYKPTVSVVSMPNRIMPESGEDSTLYESSLTVGERIIYYKKKYLNLAQRLLEEIVKNRSLL
jgi:hypothetical protein